MCPFSGKKIMLFCKKMHTFLNFKKQKKIVFGAVKPLPSGIPPLSLSIHSYFSSIKSAELFTLFHAFMPFITRYTITYYFINSNIDNKSMEA